MEDGPSDSARGKCESDIPPSEVSATFYRQKFNVLKSASYWLSPVKQFKAKILETIKLLQVSETCSQDQEEKLDMVFNCVIPYIHDVNDRNLCSLVCRRWYDLDAITRKHVVVHSYDSTSPSQWVQRFPFLESLTLEGPNPKNSGSNFTPWIQELAVSLNHLNAVHLRCMVVTDSDLELLARSCGKELRVLKIDNCKGVSTTGLLHISNFCHRLRILCLEDNIVSGEDTKWLHKLSLNNKCIESLSVYASYINFDLEDVTLLAKRCSQSLVSLKITRCNAVTLKVLFRYAVNLEDFACDDFRCQKEEYTDFEFPPNLRFMGVGFTLKSEYPALIPTYFANQITQLDLRGVILFADEYCSLVRKCMNLELLYTSDVFGDRGLEVVAKCCKKLKKLTSNRRQQAGDDMVSHKGLISLARGCTELELLHISVTDITNKALDCIGDRLKSLTDFQIILVNQRMRNTYLPLDIGVRSLLIGCRKLEKLNISLLPGGLTDDGMGYIGKYGCNLKHLRLEYAGKSNAGLVKLLKGCPKLRKLEMRKCPFLGLATIKNCNIYSLRYVCNDPYGLLCEALIQQ